VEGWRPAARKERWKICAILKFSSMGCVFKGFIRRARRPGSTAGRMPAATEKRRRAAAVQDAGAFTGDARYARSVLDCASPLALCFGGGAGQGFESCASRLRGYEKIHFDGAHFRRDIATKGSARVARAYSGVMPE